ncbi:MAG: DeoR/GlpR transcriptional regulator [Clostridiales bacterium]|nr:DeoR/GlpR transcriptional regulator [Clostridiales bacterium]
MYSERRKEIQELADTHSHVTLKELEEKYPGVSSMTLRRDLEHLERLGAVIRVKGGAVSVRQIAAQSGEDGVEPAYWTRAVQNGDAKIKIGRLACRYLDEGRSVYIDAGTTAMSMAQQLPPMRLSVFTSGPNIALELINRAGMAVSLVGGNLNRDNLALSGSGAQEFMADINIDLAFMAASGFSISGGFSCGNRSECDLKKLVISKARKVIILMDSTKVDKTLPFTFADVSDADVLICNKPLDSALLYHVTDNGVEFICE